MWPYVLNYASFWCRIWFQNFLEFLRSFFQLKRLPLSEAKPGSVTRRTILTSLHRDKGLCTAAELFFTLCAAQRKPGICKKQVHSWTVLHLVGRSKAFIFPPQNVFDQPHLHGCWLSYLTSHVTSLVHCSLEEFMQLGRVDLSHFAHNPCLLMKVASCSFRLSNYTQQKWNYTKRKL